MTTSADQAHGDAIAETVQQHGRAGVVLAVALAVLSLAWVLDLHLYAGLMVFNEQVLALALGLALATVAVSLGLLADVPRRTSFQIGGAVLLALMAYIAWRYPELGLVAITRPVWLIAICLILLIGLLFLVWRSTGLAIVAIVLIFVALALFGGPLGVPETPLSRLTLYLVIDPNAMLGLPVRVAVEIVIPFVLFGELLRQSGGSDFFTRISLAAFGRYRGGSAKAAVGASAFFGSISGNAVSNVVGTGVVTIPLMKRTGLKPETAAAVEAAASTGGQLLPPVMGAAAFVMADYLQISYTEVAVAALLPALLYFGAIFIQIDRIAAKTGILPLDESERPSAGDAFREGGHFLIPFAVLFVILFSLQMRPQIAALGAIAALIAVSIIRPYEGRRLTFSGIVRALVETGISAAPLLLITAVAGLIIGLVSLTGAGFSIAASAVAASGGNTILMLFLVAAIAIVFGMGMPTVAVYVVLATILGPALVDAGLQPIQAHLFILYFGMMSMLTPPVALASIVAAKIAGADMWRTSLAALKLAWVAYLVPFLFAFSPELLLGGSFAGAALATVTAFLGITAVSMAAAGYGLRPLNSTQRTLFLVVGVCLLLPPSFGFWVAAANAASAILFAGLLWFQRNRSAGAGHSAASDGSRSRANATTANISSMNRRVP